MHPGQRLGGNHDVTLGKDATGRFYFEFDGISGQSDNLRDGVGAFDFNDVAIRVRGLAGETIRFTNFEFGADFVAPNAIPEPMAAAFGGAAILGLVARRRRQEI